MMRSASALLFAAILAAMVVAGCAETDTETDAGSMAGYRAEVVRTEHGVAHITAADFGSLGYGEGFAAAEDHVCNIAWSILEARGELARHHGPGPNNRHLVSDIAMTALDIKSAAEALLDTQSERIVTWIEGYAAGYNRFLAEQNGSPGSWCDGAEWVRPISAHDVSARTAALALTLPHMAAAMASATPPEQDDDDPESGNSIVDGHMIAEAAESTGLSGFGSNAWAFGRDGSANGRGLLLANPHYPWYGPNRFWEKRLNVPGELEVYGANLIGMPGVAIGFNRDVAWSHTVSASQRLVFYRLELLEDNPTHYHFDGEVREMEARKVHIHVRNQEGGIDVHEQTVWFSHYGPVLNLPGFEWNDTHAFTARDANLGNHWMHQQWLALGQAQDMDAFIRAHADWNAMPWVNTIAASRDGRAVFIDGSNVGHLSDETIEAWKLRLEDDRQVAGAWAQRNWMLLDGSTSDNDWIETPGAHLPAVVPFSDKPILERSDVVFNANDSYWLSHPTETKSGYSPLYGPLETARSLRTRMNALLLASVDSEGTNSESGRFDRTAVREALFNNASLAADLLLEPLTNTCREHPEALVGDEFVDLEQACDVLAGFDGRMDLGQPGAVLFREWLSRYSYGQTRTTGELFSEPFSTDAPIATPAGLADRELARQHLAGAVRVLEEAGLALDATLDQTQFAWRGDRPVAVHGGNSHEGVANLMIARDAGWPTGPNGVKSIADSRFLTDHGYPIAHGSSFVMVVGWEEAGPVADIILGYGQSGDPDSPHFSDQTRAFAEKRWRRALFEPSDVADQALAHRLLEGERPASH